jgi:hypothetical protein
MKKQLLFDFTKSLFGKRSFRMAAFTALTLLTAQSSFAQYRWTGATSTDFLDATNWEVAPVVTYDAVTNTYTYGAVTNFYTTTVGVVNTNSVLNNTIDPAANYTIPTISIGNGMSLAIHNNITSINATCYIDGKFDFNAGTHRVHKLYIGSSAATGSVATVNVFTGAVLNGTNVWRIGEKNIGNSYLNVNGGKFTISTTGSLTMGYGTDKFGTLAITNSGIVEISGGLTIGAVGIIDVAGGSFDFSTANLNNAGTINVTAGSFKLLNLATTLNATATSATGVINIAAGGTMETVATSSLTIGNNTATPGSALVTVNVNGTMNILGTLAMPAPVTTGVYTGLINVDAGSIVLAGNQKAEMDALAVTTNVGGIKAVAGKTILVSHDPVLDKTTVVAIAAPLGVNDAKLNANAIVVYAQDQNINIQSGNVIMSDVKVYDLQGRLVASKKSIGSNETSINLNASNQVYMVKVTTADGAVVTKKIMQ